ncbi:MAG TPA: CBS domain-containing protein [Candidatus Woesearchaeota archaeon]|jgi:CBS domain-containing protein|nr:CBS domain-containing protein [Candidatus Woesearchaeota archaeon]HJN56486.1 CBS domain-containing protein [Candidatus Woesearchaeota archaeon]|tara:strand:+ start:17203 stop:17613 length:411 start_codon:yes stop_codon:yes gene_type:complete
MIVKDIMHTVTKISSNLSISKVAEIMDEKSIGSVLIEEDNEVIGIATERDILRKVVARGSNPDELKIRRIMTPDIITIDLNEDTVEAGRIMEQNKIRRIVVTENGKIVGIVTANSIAKNLKYLMARDTSKYVRPEY